MGLAIQAGLLAAFIVVFLPLGMAGWHLTRNRLLFFSVALFITLAVSVHLAPYFPSISSLVTGFRGASNQPHTSSSHCASLLHDVKWVDENVDLEDEEQFTFTRKPSDPCLVTRLWSWKQNASAVCSFQKVNRTDSLQLLKGSWIMIAGDSETRLLLLSILDQLLEPTDFVREELFKRHSNYTLRRHDIKFEFIWAPYISNLTTFVVELRHSRSYPDVLIMGGGLWHMLHVTNSLDFFDSLTRLQTAVYSLFPASSYFNPLPMGARHARSATGVPQMFWLNIPDLINPLLNTEEKRKKLTREIWTEYDDKLKTSKLLQPEGPLTLLDLHHLSKGCGIECTTDGMHYCSMVYDTAVQILLNALLIVTQQAPSK